MRTSFFKGMTTYAVTSFDHREQNIAVKKASAHKLNGGAFISTKRLSILNIFFKQRLRNTRGQKKA
jgi:hypothetical protein